MDILGIFKKNNEISEWKKQAQGNDPDALYNLGYAHFNGEGVKKDIKRAIGYWEKAVSAGSLESYYEMGLGYFEGVELGGEVILKKNVTKAVQLWEQALKMGFKSADANYLLGLTYTYGEDEVEPNLVLGIKHLCEAKSLGFAELPIEIITKLRSDLYDIKEQEVLHTELSKLLDEIEDHYISNKARLSYD